MAMDKLVDVVPPRVRFSMADGAPSTRNLIIRNASVARLQLEVDVPGPPFRFVHGGERLQGNVISLEAGESWPLRITYDQHAVAGEDVVCRFMVLRVELCKPMAIDFVAASDGVDEQAVRSLVQTRCSELLDAAPMHISAPAASVANAPSLAATASGDGEVRSFGGALGPPPAALLAYLGGEAPADAALRGRETSDAAAVDSQVSLGGQTSSATSSRRRGHQADSCDSPDTSPERSFLEGAARRSCQDDYDDRPPTPVPDGFEGMVENEVRVTNNFCAVQNSPPQRSRDTTVKAPSIGKTGSLHTNSDVAVAASACGAPDLSAETVVADRTDLFYVEGVGWCDEYGRAVADTNGDSKVLSKEITARPKPQVRSKPPSGMSDAGSTTGSSARVSSKGRPVTKDTRPTRLSQREIQQNWDALGGI